MYEMGRSGLLEPHIRSPERTDSRVDDGRIGGGIRSRT
jgi:hypothetical protein